MHRLRTSLGLALLFSCFAAAPQASAQQSLNLYFGGFMPRGNDGRGPDDVLFQNQDFLYFDISDFNGATAGAEWLIPLGDYVEAGIGVGYYAKTVYTVYTDLISPEGFDIEQDLRLRIAPVAATFRVLPFGRRVPVQPYVGAGVGIYAWQYSETGEFVDPVDLSIFSDVFVASGTDVGPIVFGGVRIPFGSLSVGAEIRYQSGKGTLPADLGFAGPTIDLGGLNVLATFGARF